MRFRQHFFDCLDQLPVFDRLPEHSVRAQHPALFTQFIWIGQDKDRQERMKSAQEIERFHSVDIRDIQVQQDGVKWLVQRPAQGFVAGLGPDEFVVFTVQRPGERSIGGLFIFYNEDSSFHNSKGYATQGLRVALARPQADASRLGLGLCRSFVIGRSLTMPSHHDFARQPAIAFVLVEYVHLFARL